MDDLVRQGKVLYFGTSHYAPWQICRGLWYAEVTHRAHWVVDQPRYNLIDRAIEQELVPCCQALGYGLVPHSPLAGGFLTGKYQRGQAAPAESRGSRNPDRFTPTRDDRNFAVLTRLSEIAQINGCSVGQAAIAWVVAHPWVSSTIIGPRTMEQFEDNLGAATVTLSADDRAALDQVSAYAAQLPRT